MKTCITCKIEKPATPEYFNRAKRNKDGLNNKCKKCRKESKRKYYKESKNKKFIYDDKIMRACAECKIEKPATIDYFSRNNLLKDGLVNTCKECKKEYKRNHYRENKEHYARHREERREYFAKYRKENPEVYRMSSQRRRARIAELPHDLTLEEWDETLEYFNNECAYCGVPEDNLHQEHVVPVSKGGGYTVDNIIPACKSCNSSKHARDMKEWYSEQEFFNIGRLILINKWIEAGIIEAERATEEEE